MWSPEGPLWIKGSQVHVKSNSRYLTECWCLPVAVLYGLDAFFCMFLIGCADMFLCVFGTVTLDRLMSNANPRQKESTCSCYGVVGCYVVIPSSLCLPLRFSQNNRSSHPTDTRSYNDDSVQDIFLSS